MFWDTNQEFMSHDELVARVKSRAVDNDAKIPFAAIGIFWTKLDSRPLFLDEEEINVEEQLQAVKQQIMTQPTKKSDKKPRVVQTDVHGRTTSKVQHQKKQDSQHSVIDQP
ncbi:hypothetical protein R6Q57_021266 [Mikania cordata]